ncbi:MAG: 2-phosphosulfolactate phosphatase [Bacteroidales bacterium]|nr:2-phosphosulfolactate phosphatase [Bacteroidales bacterium]
MSKIEICFSPALINQYVKKDSVVVVTDVFRASTTICTAFANGAKSIIPVESQQEAIDYKAKGYLTGAERKVARCDFADFGNSPFEYTPDKVSGKEIVLTTSNGTRAIKAASDCFLLLIGAFVNLRAVAERCQKESRDVLIVCAGWKDRICVEDSLFAGALTSCLLEDDRFQAASDGTRIAVSLWHHANKDFNKYMMKSEHAQRLLAGGFEDDLNYCLKQSIFDVVPELNGNKLIYDKSDRIEKRELEEALVD